MEIRNVCVADTEAIAAIRRQDGVREKILALSSERDAVTEDFIRSLADCDRGFTAVRDGEVVGFGVLLRNREPNRAHCASVAVMVDGDCHGMGIGHALLKRITQEADNVLKLHRLELLVLVDNKNAIKIYRDFGFCTEAVKRHAAVVNGKFVDEFLMGRIKAEDSK
ncbi:MAG: GNAT family N-acetyltransferase [Synergistes sp.]|nr:GNAT family N-acetyltransferase [Synergistes sp.]